MQTALGSITGKAVRAGLKFRRHGGHTLPGLIVEKIFPGYLEKMLAQLPEGVVLVTGTNGKTTTTKIITELLKANGKEVLTNQTGSNLTRGIVSSVSRHATIGGKLHQQIAVLEVDEAQAGALVKRIKPRWVLALNVSRDQLDRFGEVDTVAAYIGSAMQQATEGVIANARDPHLVTAAGQVKKGVRVVYFGAASKLSRYFPTDYELAAVNRSVKSREKSPEMSVELIDFNDRTATYKIANKNYGTKLKLTGQHNFLNAAAALATVKVLVPNVRTKDLLNQVSNVELAFGRGETYRLKNGRVIELVLVKNPASFTQALASYGAGKQDLMIAINDNIADGRDVSWLWDVNFEPLHGREITVTSGSRAADMALRLSYDDIQTKQIEPNLIKAIDVLSEKPGKKVVLATYTAMLQLYKLLLKKGDKLS